MKEKRSCSQNKDFVALTPSRVVKDREMERHRIVSGGVDAAWNLAAAHDAVSTVPRHGQRVSVFEQDLQRCEDGKVGRDLLKWLG